MYAGAVLLYHHGVLSVRSAVRDPARRQGDPAHAAAGLGQADHQRHELPALTQDHTSRPQIT